MRNFTRSLMVSVVVSVVGLSVAHAAVLEAPQTLRGFEVLYSQGQVVKANYSDAVQLCASRGLRLPTAREFAALSIAFGAVGFDGPKAYKVPSESQDGREDTFYFDHSGYQAPAGPLGTEMFWTSSAVWGHATHAHVYYGEFGGGGGQPHEHHKGYLNSVACVAGSR